MPLARQQFAELALEQLPMVHRLARRLCRDPGRAEDLAQDALLRAMRFADSFELREFGIGPWLTRIVYSTHFNHLRRSRREPGYLAADPEDHSEAIERDGGEADPYGFEQMDEELVKAVQMLTASYREPLLLWALRELDYAEIAKTLGVPVGTVMSRLHRARKQLRERLAGAGRSALNACSGQDSPLPATGRLR